MSSMKSVQYPVLKTVADVGVGLYHQGLHIFLNCRLLNRPSLIRVIGHWRAVRRSQIELNLKLGFEAAFKLNGNSTINQTY